MKLSLYLFLAVGMLLPGSLKALEQVDGIKHKSHPHVFENLNPKMDGKSVTVRFTVSGLYGISQLSVPGQSPSFGIHTDEKRLTVWIEGELANVLDRFQMRYLQSNQLQKKTVIEATGKLIMQAERGLDIGLLDQNGKPTEWVRKNGKESYTLHVSEWKNFRIVNAPKPKKE